MFKIQTYFLPVKGVEGVESELERENFFQGIEMI